nr:putative sulfate exporter family transporter [Hyphomonas sp. Mor2]
MTSENQASSEAAQTGQLSSVAHHDDGQNKKLEALSSVYPGLLVAGTISIAATWLSSHYGTPAMLLALLLGIAFNFLGDDARCKAGIEFSCRTLLRIGVALLGVRITFDQLQSLGVLPVAMVVSGVLLTILFGILLARAFKFSYSFGVLTGGSVAICGASAALAISSVLPNTKHSEQNTLLAVVAVTTLSTIAMVVYPVIAASLDLTTSEAGLFLGGTIHDVAQVVGAGYSVSEGTGDIATYVKLLRVAMLMPVVFVIAIIVANSAKHVSDARPGIPLFLVGFAMLVVVSSTINLPEQAISGISSVSSWCLITAISALGVKTSFGKIATLGWKPLFIIIMETVWIALLVLGFVLVLHAQNH